MTVYETTPSGEAGNRTEEKMKRDGKRFNEQFFCDKSINRQIRWWTFCRDRPENNLDGDRDSSRIFYSSILSPQLIPETDPYFFLMIKKLASDKL